MRPSASFARCHPEPAKRGEGPPAEARGALESGGPSPSPRLRMTVGALHDFVLLECAAKFRRERSAMESSLEIGFLRAAEKAAIASARTMGYGKRKYSDQVAVEAMREELNRLKMRGSVVIGEGERDKAPMLYVGEPLGRGWTEGEIYPEVDIAVDPLEGTNLCATGAANSIATIAASEKGGLLNAPDVYMDKIVVGPTAGEFVGLTQSVQENLNQIAEAFQRDVDELTIIVLDRER